MNQLQQLHATVSQLVDLFSQRMGIDHYTSILALIEYLATLAHRNAPMETEEYLEALNEHFQTNQGFPKGDEFYELHQQLRDTLRLMVAPTVH